MVRDYDDNYSDSFNLTVFNSTLSGNELEDYVIVPILVLISIIGLLVNGALIYILFKTNVRSTINAFLVSLAVKDMITILFCVPFLAKSSFPFGDVLCKLSKGLEDICSGVTSFSLTALTVYCFFETSPTPQSWTWRTSVNVVAGVWALAVIVAGPSVVYFQLYYENEGKANEVAYCLSYSAGEGPMRFAMYYAMPLIAASFFYSIARLSGTLNRQTVAQREVSTLTIWLVVVYAVCLFIIAINTFWFILSISDDKVWRAVDITGFYLSVLYCCLNPFVLYCVSGNFRQQFNRYLLCWCVKGNRLQESEMERNRPQC